MTKYDEELKKKDMNNSTIAYLVWLGICAMWILPGKADFVFKLILMFIVWLFGAMFIATYFGVNRIIQNLMYKKK